MNQDCVIPKKRICPKPPCRGPTPKGGGEKRSEDLVAIDQRRKKLHNAVEVARSSGFLDSRVLGVIMWASPSESLIRKPPNS